MSVGMKETWDPSICTSWGPSVARYASMHAHQSYYLQWQPIPEIAFLKLTQVWQAKYTNVAGVWNTHLSDKWISWYQWVLSILLSLCTIRTFPFRELLPVLCTPQRKLARHLDTTIFNGACSVNSVQPHVALQPQNNTCVRFYNEIAVVQRRCNINKCAGLGNL